MPKHRKTFPCGHRGFGQTCQHCRQIEQQRQQLEVFKAKQHQAKQAWKASFQDDPIDLRGLPAHIVQKARQVLTALANGSDYRQFRGKRLHYDRAVVSIPLNYDYRLLCEELEGKLVPRRVMSHEEYNGTKPGT